MKKAVLGLSFMEKEQEKITLQPNIYRKENKQHQIENQRLWYHPFRPQEWPNPSGSNRTTPDQHKSTLTTGIWFEQQEYHATCYVHIFTITSPQWKGSFDKIIIGSSLRGWREMSGSLLPLGDPHRSGRIMGWLYQKPCGMDVVF